MSINVFTLKPNESVAYVTEFGAGAPQRIMLLNPDTGEHYFVKERDRDSPISGVLTNTTTSSFRVQVYAESFRNISDVEMWRPIRDSQCEINDSNPFLTDLPQTQNGFSVTVRHEDGADRDYNDSIVRLRFYNLRP